MMTGCCKRVFRQLCAQMGFRITRLRPANRFEATRESLLLAKSCGYSPRIVVDGGANLGDWTRMTLPIFPVAQFHLIEPQPACMHALRALAGSAKRVILHPVVLTEPGVSELRLIGGGGFGGTGAWVARAHESAADEIRSPAGTLDALLADQVDVADRALLKLDLEGSEMSALRGAERLLRVVEVVLTELQFYEVHDNGWPVFGDVVDFMRRREFELYDIASLSGRPRDKRLRLGDVMFVRRDSPLQADVSWE